MSIHVHRQVNRPNSLSGLVNPSSNYHNTVSQPSETTRFGEVSNILLHVRYYGDVYSSFEFIIEVETIDDSPGIQEDRGEHDRLGRTDDS